MDKKFYKQTLLIDLDGVLNNYGLDGKKFDANYIPEIKTGAKDFIEKLYTLGRYELVLFTTRNSLLASQWLMENNIDKYFKNVTSNKIPAVLHIDDRAICFSGDYDKILDVIISFKPYWK